jgi:hypothetical protein
MPPGSPGKWVFWPWPGAPTGKEADESWLVHGKIESISHRELGRIRRVSIGDLLYELELLDGERIVIDSEERPGSAESHHQIIDWTLQVDIVRTPHALYDLIERTQEESSVRTDADWKAVAAATLLKDHVIASLSDQLIRRAHADPSPALLEALESDDEERQRAALEAIRRYKCSSSVVGAALIALLRRSNGPLAYRSAQALAELRPQDGPLLMHAIKDWAASERLKVVQYLSKIVPPAFPVLELLSQDPDPSVRQSVVEVLRRRNG